MNFPVLSTILASILTFKPQLLNVEDFPFFREFPPVDVVEILNIVVQDAPHGIGIFAYICPKLLVNVGKYCTFGALLYLSLDFQNHQVIPPEVILRFGV